MILQISCLECRDDRTYTSLGLWLVIAHVYITVSIQLCPIILTVALVTSYQLSKSTGRGDGSCIGYMPNKLLYRRKLTCLVSAVSTMSNSRSTTMRHTKILIDDQCPLCRNVFANVYLKRRHMGAVHGMDKDCRPISVERRKYLRLQSARKYVRNRHRTTDIQSPAEVSTSQKPTFDCTTMDIDGKLDTTTLDYHSNKSDEDNEYKMFQQVMSEYENAYNRVCKRKPKKSSLSEYTETLQWSKY